MAKVTLSCAKAGAVLSVTSRKPTRPDHASRTVVSSGGSYSIDDVESGLYAVWVEGEEPVQASVCNKPAEGPNYTYDVPLKSTSGYLWNIAADPPSAVFVCKPRPKWHTPGRAKTGRESRFRPRRSRGVEATEDAAFGDRMRCDAARAQRLEVCLKRAKFPDALRDVADVFVEQRVDVATILRG